MSLHDNVLRTTAFHALASCFPNRHRPTGPMDENAIFLRASEELVLLRAIAEADTDMAAARSVFSLTSLADFGGTLRRQSHARHLYREWQRQQKPPPDSPEWTGDLDDDCTAIWRGLMLRAEALAEDSAGIGTNWWWAVYDGEGRRGYEQLSSSDDAGESEPTGVAARAAAERAARKHLASQKETEGDKMSKHGAAVSLLHCYDEDIKKDIAEARSCVGDGEFTEAARMVRDVFEQRDRIILFSAPILEAPDSPAQHRFVSAIVRRAVDGAMGLAKHVAVSATEESPDAE